MTQLSQSIDASLTAVWSRLRTTLRRWGTSLSAWLATIDAWQLRTVARRLRPTAADAEVTIRADTPVRAIQAELENAGWMILDVNSPRPDLHRLTLRARLSHGKPAEVAAHAATQLRITLAGHHIMSLRVTGEPGDAGPFHQWGVKLTEAATDAERLRVSSAVEGRVIAGDEAETRDHVRTLLSEAHVPDAAWDLVPMNSAAAAARPDLQAVTPGFFAGIVLVVAGAVAAIIGVAVPSQLLLQPNEMPTAAAVASFIAAGACLVAFYARAYWRHQKGKRQNWIDIALILGVTYLPLLFPAAALGERIGPGWTLGAYVGVLMLVFVFVWVGRPPILTARYSAKRTARNVLVSVTAVVVVLNIPAAMFLLGARELSLLGSIPIGTVIVSGAVALTCVAIATAAAGGAARLFRRSPGVSLSMLLCLWAVFLAALGLFANIVVAYSDGRTVAERGTYSSPWSFGLEPVCVTTPNAHQTGTFWLVGTAGRTSYLLPRLVSEETGAEPITVDSNEPLTYTAAGKGCE